MVIRIFISVLDASITTEQEQSQPAPTHMMGSFYRHISHRSGTDADVEDHYISHSCKPSPSSKSKAFSQFFPSKAVTHEDKSKRTASLETKINAIFDKYKDDNEEDMIMMNGLERLCEDLGLQLDDFPILVLAWKFNAEQMCQFTRQEVINGCKVLDVENVSQIRSKLSDLILQLRTDSQAFKSLYRFTFKLGLDRTSGQRILPIDIAVCLWKLVFTVHKPPILDRWLIFLQSDQAHIRGIPRDTWNMFLNFLETIGNDLSTYDDTEAWPSIFDEFVEYENDRVNQNITLLATFTSNLKKSHS